MSANPFFNPTQYARPAGTPSQAWFDAHNLGAGGAQNLSSAAGGGAAQGPASFGQHFGASAPLASSYAMYGFNQNMGQRSQHMAFPSTGADRPGYGWRQERRQAKNAGTYDPTSQPQGGGAQPEPAMMGGGYGGQQMNGMAQYFGQLPPGFGQGPQGGYGVGGIGMGGGSQWDSGFNTGNSMSMPWGMQGMNYGGGYGGYNPSMGGGWNLDASTSGSATGGWRGGLNQTGLAEPGQMPTGAQRPGMQYRQDRRQARQRAGETY